MVGGPMMYRRLMLTVCYLLLLGCCTHARRNPRERRPADQQGQTQQGPSGGRHRSREAVIKAFERNLLNMFGLKEKPQPARKIHVPQYMLDLYNAQAETPFNGIDVTVQGKPSRTTNIVRSFHHQDNRDDYSGLLDDSFSPDGHKHRLVFNVSAIANEEVLSAAELRLYWDDGHHSVAKRDLAQATENATVPPEKSHRHRVNVYQILKPVVKNKDVIKRLIDTRVVDIRNATWQTFDVRPAILDWRRTQRANHGIEVEVLDHRGRPSGRRNLRVARSVSRSESPAEEEEEEEEESRWYRERPHMVTYTDDGRRKRASGGGRSSRERSSKRKRRLKPNCRRHPLYVDFTDVGWNTWIVAPAGYQAYYCQGECPFPLTDHLNATNHAIVQTLVNSASPQLAPKACCVPTDLSPISMLYLDDTEAVILRNYQDMVVEGCGCR